MITAAEELSEQEIQAQLAGESTKGPRTFRGKTLAPLSRGLRDLRAKVIIQGDTNLFHDVALLLILENAHAETDAARLAARRALLAATDDVAGFRAQVSLRMDDLTDAEIDQARAIVDDIFDAIQKAEVFIAEKKSDPAAVPPAAALNPTTTP